MLVEAHGTPHLGHRLRQPVERGLRDHGLAAAVDLHHGHDSCTIGTAGFHGADLVALALQPHRGQLLTWQRGDVGPLREIEQGKRCILSTHLGGCHVGHAFSGDHLQSRRHLREVGEGKVADGTLGQRHRFGPILHGRGQGLRCALHATDGPTEHTTHDSGLQSFAEDFLERLARVETGLLDQTLPQLVKAFFQAFLRAFFGDALEDVGKPRAHRCLGSRRALLLQQSFRTRRPTEKGQGSGAKRRQHGRGTRGLHRFVRRHALLLIGLHGIAKHTAQRLRTGSHGATRNGSALREHGPCHLCGRLNAIRLSLRLGQQSSGTDQALPDLRASHGIPCQSSKFARTDTGQQ